uniref:ATP synthase F0 subunit 8 n=1 Tax=Exallonyx sp. ZJUH_2016014 TaxID=2491158 RepID=A0A3S5HLP3_9HYME|nr:ATP synthase F0 subunit 8 [Exallonyx sp. ZJUH_2016014]
MPQMMPMNWLLIFYYSLFIFLMNLIILFFFFFMNLEYSMDSKKMNISFNPSLMMKW